MSVGVKTKSSVRQGGTAKIVATFKGLVSSDSSYAVKGGKQRNGVYRVKDLSCKYIKLNIAAIRSSGISVVQFSVLNFIDTNGTAMSWSGASVTSSLPGGSGEGIENILDGSVDTKYCANGFNSSTGCEIIIYRSGGFDLNTYNRYQYYTANDVDGRDPITWAISISDDGSTWVQVDERRGEAGTTTRKALAGTWSVSAAGYFQIDDVDEYGEWTVYATHNGSTISMTVNIDAADTFSAPFSWAILLTTANIDTYFTVSDDSYYFGGADSTWTSTNYNINSSAAQSTWTALQDMTVVMPWSVSSESNYDKLTITAAGATKVNAVSGTQSGTITFSLTTGQTIVLRYAKDSSTHKNNDVATVSGITVETA